MREVMQMIDKAMSHRICWTLAFLLTATTLVVAGEVRSEEAALARCKEVLESLKLNYDLVGSLVASTHDTRSDSWQVNSKAGDFTMGISKRSGAVTSFVDNHVFNLTAGTGHSRKPRALRTDKEIWQATDKFLTNSGLADGNLKRERLAWPSESWNTQVNAYYHGDPGLMVCVDTVSGKTAYFQDSRSGIIGNVRPGPSQQILTSHELPKGGTFKYPKNARAQYVAPDGTVWLEMFPNRYMKVSR